MLQALTFLAQAEHEPSKTAFYFTGGALAAFAVILGAIGIRAHATFPPSRGGARAVMGLAALLVAATMATAIITS